MVNYTSDFGQRNRPAFLQIGQCADGAFNGCGGCPLGLSGCHQHAHQHEDADEKIIPASPS
ncbi:MAG: hypothetical protein HPY45_15495 [Anaerolineae bacterium]|nr:hypothetical protein [Anaerolineae bacterium]